MVVFGQSGCIRQSPCIRERVVVFGQRGCIRAKWLYSGKSRCVRKNWLKSGTSGCNRAKLFYLGKVVVFGRSCCIEA